MQWSCIKAVLKLYLVSTVLHQTVLKLYVAWYSLITVCIKLYLSYTLHKYNLSTVFTKLYLNYTCPFFDKSILSIVLCKLYLCQVQFMTSMLTSMPIEIDHRRRVGSAPPIPFALRGRFKYRHMGANRKSILCYMEQWKKVGFVRTDTLIPTAVHPPWTWRP